LYKEQLADVDFRSDETNSTLEEEEKERIRSLFNDPIQSENEQKQKNEMNKRIDKNLASMIKERKVIRFKREKGLLCENKANQIESELNQRIDEQNELKNKNIQILKLLVEEKNKRLAILKKNQLHVESDKKTRKVIKTIKTKVEKKVWYFTVKI
jgi:transposase